MNSERVGEQSYSLTCTDCNHVTVLPPQLVVFVLYCSFMEFFLCNWKRFLFGWFLSKICLTRKKRKLCISVSLFSSSAVITLRPIKTSFLLHNLAESVFKNVIVLVDIFISLICRLKTLPALSHSQP